MQAAESKSVMRVLVDLDSKTLRPSKALAPMIRHLCSALVVANQTILRAGNVPPLYLSGVRYRPEPKNWTVERFDNAETCFKRGWGDCDDLASWLCAEYRNKGIAAGIIVAWKPADNGKLYHIKVRLPNGREEDPSLKLGMRAL